MEIKFVFGLDCAWGLFNLLCSLEWMSAGVKKIIWGETKHICENRFYSEFEWHVEG